MFPRLLVHNRKLNCLNFQSAFGLYFRDAGFAVASREETSTALAGVVTWLRFILISEMLHIKLIRVINKNMDIQAFRLLLFCADICELAGCGSDSDGIKCCVSCRCEIIVNRSRKLVRWFWFIYIFAYWFDKTCGGIIVYSNKLETSYK